MRLSCWWRPSNVAEQDNKGAAWLKQQIAAAGASQQAISEALTPYDSVTGYNNFYEFGFEKTDPAANSGKLTTAPWTVEIAGEMAKPGKYNLEDWLKGVDLEERVYRLRCVEAWSMVIPWVGFLLAELLKRFEPTSKVRSEKRSAFRQFLDN